MGKVEFEIDEGLERASLKQQLAQYLEQKTPLKRLSTFYKENGLEEYLAPDENALIDPNKSGMNKSWSLRRILIAPLLRVNGPQHSKMERLFITKACRTFCHKTLGFGAMTKQSIKQ